MGAEVLEKTIHFLKERLLRILKIVKHFSKEIDNENRHFTVLEIRKVDKKIDEDGFILLLYFIDNTELINEKEVQ